MITKLLYKCRRCDTTYYPDFGKVSLNDVLLMQVSVHECGGTAADGHIRMGISDLKGFNETRDDAQEEQHGH